MNPNSNQSMYEIIQHPTNTAAKVIITCMRSSAYHWHYDYELIAVLKGRVEVLYGPEVQQLSAGDVVLINSKGVHGYRGIDLDNICLFIQFSPNLLEPVAAGMKYHFFLNSSNERYKPKLPYGRYMELATKIGLAHRMEGSDSNLRVNAWMYMLLADLLAGVQYELCSSPSNKINEENAQLVVSIGSYVDEHIVSENLSEEICRHFGLSEKSLYRLLKETAGLTLKAMIDVARIHRACALLQDCTIPASIVAGECGYSGEVTFYRRFKSAMGMTPGEYRKGFEVNSAGVEIQDYLTFNEKEVNALLRHWAKVEE
jgi:AraC-like DNA-binding protein